MRAVIQRVNHASVEVDNKIISKIDKGLLVLLGVEESDENSDLIYMADKVSGLRIFEDSNEKMNLSVKDVSGEVLVVSQFTLLGDCKKGKRPSFKKAMEPSKAEEMYLSFCKEMKNYDLVIKEGQFGADMKVSLENDGPVTIMIDSRKTF
jgi:D-tyrosyl-tRNA(Tyr) deacylase